MRTCPHCGKDTQQRKDGQTKAGSLRYRCGYCQRKYTPVPKEQGYPPEIRQQAVKLYVDGMNFRRIARHLKVNHQSVINWVNAYIVTLPDQTPQPKSVTTVELDEVFTFIGEKNRAYIMTLVDRRTSCILAWAVEFERTQAVMQALVDRATQARFYYSDLFAIYRQLVYFPGLYTPMPDKSETYRVEGDNAEIRHDLARLVRCSRCFSRCIQALRRAMKLFVYAWNRRQLYHLTYPKYPAHLFQFV